MVHDLNGQMAAKAAIRLCDKLVSHDTKLADALDVDQNRLLRILHVLIKDETCPITRGHVAASNSLGDFFVLPVRLQTTAEHDFYFDTESVVCPNTGESSQPELRCVDGGSPEALAQISQSLKDWLTLTQTTQSNNTIKRAAVLQQFAISPTAFDRAVKNAGLERQSKGMFLEAEIFSLARRLGWERKS